MIGRTLGGYFFRRYTVITAWNFLGIAALVFIVTFTEIAGRAGDLEGYSAQWALGLAALQLPIIMQQVVPFVGLISAMATLISLNRKYELVVARAAGISAWQFLAPIALGAFIFGLLAVLILSPIAAAGFSKAQTIEAEVRGAKTRANTGEERWIKQRTQSGETIIGADAALEGGTALVRPVFFIMDQEDRIVERLDARRAWLRDGHWELNDVTRRRGGGPPETLATVDVPTSLQSEFVGQQLTQPEAVSVFALPAKIEVARSFGLRANAFAMYFHSLVTLPPLLVAMTLIAATVSMRFARMGQSVTVILGGVLAGFLLYVVSVLVKAFGSAGFVPPFVAAWVPVVVAMFFGVTFLLFKEDG
ncbi:LPS export ABC transporter permease LptG [Chelativorans salis]|uniref:LPS export ABC transporter permease LptG n=1 Tax=Chelativorans salis TaxID=2978478 RepID=A0ABT2LQ35_9HYPH|nr:LPS export ABC transporter permease LptG [Chelativorans sp. EGI FJ00035]MCT7375927.1 LPS export ABC transporter permease LptG [Chelativorans sp. EGI FJ00035]